MTLRTPGFYWSDDNVEQLRIWAAGKMSASAIALAFGGGLSRNAVIGKLNRLGLKSDGARRPAAPRQPKSPSACRVATRRISAGAARQLVAQAESALPETADPFSPKGCRWPIGDFGAPDFRFCQLERFTTPAGRQSSWCEAHHALGHRAA